MSESSAPVILLGNPNPQMQVYGPDGAVHSEPAEHLTQTVTRVELAETTLDPEKGKRALSTDNDRMLIAVARQLPDADRNKYALVCYELEGILAVHMAGATPTWVSSDDKKLAQVVASYFKCALGEPENVFTNGGRDALHEQHLKSTQPAAFKFGALSGSAHTPEAADTTLAEEITTAEGGLLREEMTFAHSAGTNTSTLTHTWTTNAKDALPVTVKLWANFNKTKEAGTMGEEDKLSTSATLSAAGDSITVTFTLTAG